MFLTILHQFCTLWGNTHHFGSRRKRQFLQFGFFGGNALPSNLPYFIFLAKCFLSPNPSYSSSTFSSSSQQAWQPLRIFRPPMLRLHLPRMTIRTRHLRFPEFRHPLMAQSRTFPTPNCFSIFRRTALKIGLSLFYPREV